jgi:hypothetical protein
MTKFIIGTNVSKGLVSSVGTATDYGLDDRGSNPAEAGNFSLRHHVQTGSGAHPASYPMCTGGSFPRSGRGVKLITHPHLVPRSKDVFMAWYLVKQRGNFTFHTISVPRKCVELLQDTD